MFHGQRDRREREVGRVVAQVVREDVLAGQAIVGVNLDLQEVAVSELVDQPPHAVVGAAGHNADGDLARNGVDQL